MGMTLAELANHCNATVRGDSTYQIEGVSSIEAAGPRDIVFVAGSRYFAGLNTTRAGAVMLAEHDASRFSGNVLVCKNPRLGFTLIARLLNPVESPPSGVHPEATISADARLHPSAAIGARVVIESGAEVGAGTVIEAGCVIGRNAKIGENCRLAPNVAILRNCIIGNRCEIQAGAVIGSDGFGFARDGDSWIKTPQLGTVIVGDDVEVGANTTIDRGALGDTIIHRGVKLDNLIHVAHNVEIGDDTAIAACVGIAGSTRIGKRCTIAGQAGIVGHIEIADDVHITGATVVSHTIRKPGIYSSGSPIEPYQSWLRNAVRMRQLDEMARRIKKLEEKLQASPKGGHFEKP